LLTARVMIWRRVIRSEYQCFSMRPDRRTIGWSSSAISSDDETFAGTIFARPLSVGKPAAGAWDASRQSLSDLDTRRDSGNGGNAV
jgi:hypothetical protein